MHILKPIALTADAFHPFGQVIETGRRESLLINQGFARRFNDLCRLDVADGGGQACLSLFTAEPRAYPYSVQMMERHPLGSQAFIPLQKKDWLLIVCTAPDDASSYLAFRASGGQGVNYAKGVWHHPLLVLSAGESFVVVDRKGPGLNLEEHWRDAQGFISLHP